MDNGKVCKCGCGGLTINGNDYINGHQNRGRTRNNDCCYKCGDILTVDNWYASSKRLGQYVCKDCINEYTRFYRSTHYIKSTNKESGQYLGVDISERIVLMTFKDAVQMPLGNPGYDVILYDKYIDVKSSATGDNRDYWMFTINYNTIADCFLCIAYTNIQDLNIIHAWLIPGYIVNNLPRIKICKSALGDWIQYEIPIDKMVVCCNYIKSGALETTD